MLGYTVIPLFRRTKAEVIILCYCVSVSLDGWIDNEIQEYTTGNAAQHIHTEQEGVNQKEDQNRVKRQSDAKSDQYLIGEAYFQAWLWGTLMHLLQF